MKVILLITHPSLRGVWLKYAHNRPETPMQEYVKKIHAYETPEYRAATLYTEKTGDQWLPSDKLCPLLCPETLEKTLGIAGDTHVFLAIRKHNFPTLNWKYVTVAQLERYFTDGLLDSIEDHIFNLPTFRIAVRLLKALSKEIK